MAYKEKNGKWRGVVKCQGQRQTGIFETKREAKDWEEQVRKELRKSGTPPLQSIYYVGPWIEAYLVDIKNKNQEREWREKFNFFKTFLAVFPPDLPISRITSDLVVTFLDRDPNRSGNARNKDLDRLQAAWKWAVKRHGFPFRSPFACFDEYPEIRKVKYVPPMRDILKVIEASSGEERFILLLSLATAARRVELFRIQVGTDLIFEDNIVVLTTEKTNGKGQRRDRMKIPAELSTALREYIEANKITGSLFKYSCPERGNWDDWFKAFCLSQDIKPFTIHGIRHRIATDLIKQRVALTDVQALLRHTRATTTDGYIHAIGEHLDVTNHLNAVVSSFLLFPQVA